MCGIAGQIRFDGRSVEREVLERMCAAIEHRGPDSRGVHLENGVGLGIQRLRIIDLHTGDQPIYNEDRSVVTVLNGEIYNYRELRERLERSGHEFATQTDTEVIVHLYEEEGPDLVRSLHGMFAFALWDERRRRLVLARDRVGKKPLFYAERNGVLSFGSELNAVMQDPELSREVDHGALDSYLAFRWVPTPQSAFRAVRKLPPASTLVMEDGRSTIAPYWSLDYGPKLEVGDLAEFHERVRSEIRAATARRLVADVPLGAFLSGGVDSSAVVAAMAESTAQPVKTFSIGFTSDGYNELPLARLVAERFGTEHHEFVVEPKAMEILPKIVRHHGEPFADSSSIPSFYVAQIARRHVTVALNGDGGDETFGGYTRYVSNMALRRTESIPRPLRRALPSLARALPRSGRVDSWPSRLRRVAFTLALDPSARYTAYMTRLNGMDRDELYTPEYRELVGASRVPDVMGVPWRQSSGRSAIDVMLDVDVSTYLTDDLLVKMDIASMASSLEARSPLLDHRFMEFAASVPSHLKVRGTEKKVGLRGAMRGWVPDEVLDAPKRGFRAPIADWFREELRDYAYEVLLDPATTGRGHFRADYVRRLLDRHTAGIEDHSQGIWTLLNYELWHREFVDRGAPTALAQQR